MTRYDFLLKGLLIHRANRNNNRNKTKPGHFLHHPPQVPLGVPSRNAFIYDRGSPFNYNEGRAVLLLRRLQF